MILVDTSAWIEYFRPQGQAAVRAAVAEAVERDVVAVNGIIQVELLAFARDDDARRRLAAAFEAFVHLDIDRRHFDLASTLGFDLRRRGVTVPATDLIIAASAIDAQAVVYHVDRHFEKIAENTELDQRQLSTRG